MALKQEKDLNDQLRTSWLKAVTAIELHNFGYAIELLQNLLKQEPSFLTARQILRRAEVTRAKTEKKGFFNISTAPIAVMKAQRELKKNPHKTIELIEKVLETNPYGAQANMLLKEAALAVNLPEIAVFALETLLENEPKNTKVLHELGRLHDQLDQADKAVEVYNRICEIDPLDLEAVRLGKDASARASIKKGGWVEAESYRDLIKDKQIAVSLEQQNKMQLSLENLEQQIDEVFARHETDSQNVELARRLGLLHEQKGDLEGAIAWYEYAVALTNKADPGLVRKVADLKMRQLEQQIRAEEQYLASHDSSDPTCTERKARLEQARQARAEILIEDARKRVERNPTDLQVRCELGERLAQAGLYRDALPQLQRARQNPHARLKAMNLLGRCYRELGMLDLAARQLEDASQEMMMMDAVKKESLYDLGLVYEQMGDRTRYLEAMKRIYEADYGYRDVAARVESSYRPSGDEPRP
jgi:tetratricopeptide (TPR) repeat protein